MTQELGFIFPGQGSQKAGMLAELASEYDLVQKTFSEASEVLAYDLWALVQNGPNEELALTHITQPAILTASVAIHRVWQSCEGASPAMMAGHSLGEYSALVCAGVIEFSDAVTLVRKRGEFMQSAVPVGTGGMAAIVGLDDEAVLAACQTATESAAAGEVVAAVNFNSPGQVVIAGSAAAVQKASELCKEAGAKRALPLPVSAPFHSPLMKPAADAFTEVIAAVSMQSPTIPVLQNFSLACSDNPEDIKNNLISQIYNPVPWVDTINYFATQGISRVLELGPGKVLTGLNKRIQPEMDAVAVNEPAGMTEMLSQLRSI